MGPTSKIASKNLEKRQSNLEMLYINKGNKRRGMKKGGNGDGWDGIPGLKDEGVAIA